MLNQIHLAIQHQHALLKYVEAGIWKQDQDKQTLRDMVGQLESELSATLELKDFMDEQTVQYCRSVVFEQLQRVREINHSLQGVFKQSVHTKTFNHFVIAELPARGVAKSNKLSQLIKPFKQSLQVIEDAYHSLEDVPKVEEGFAIVQRQQTLLQLAEKFKFELKCLQNETNESKSLLGEEYFQVQAKINIIGQSKLNKQIVEFCGALQRIKIELKKQKVLVKQFPRVEIDEKQFESRTRSIHLCRPPKFYPSSEETDYSQEQSPQKSQLPLTPVQKQVQVQDEACLCFIF